MSKENITVVVTIMTKEKVARKLEFIGEECHSIRISLMTGIKEIAIGEILQLVTDNPKSQKSIYKWCRDNNQQLFLSDTKDGLFIYYIKRQS